MDMILGSPRALRRVALLSLWALAAIAGVAGEIANGDPRPVLSAVSQGRAAPEKKSAAKRRLLKPEDLVYEGAFALPKKVQEFSTSYAHIGLAMRMVDGERRFFAGAGPDDSGVYEMTFPGLAKLTGDNRSWPTAKVVKWWGDITQGKCVVANNKNPVLKHGLFWDESMQRLYWT